MRDAEALADMPAYSAQLPTRHCARARPRRPSPSGSRALVAVCDARLTAAYGAHASGLAARDGGALMPPLRVAAIGAGRYAMEAAVDAATAFVRRPRGLGPPRGGARPRAARAGHGARSRASTGSTPWRSRSPRARPDGRAGRQGLTNAEIAERLVLSVRTVETHIYRAMQKLGVSDRRD